MERPSFSDLQHLTVRVDIASANLLSVLLGSFKEVQGCRWLCKASDRNCCLDRAVTMRSISLCCSGLFHSLHRLHALIYSFIRSCTCIHASTDAHARTQTLTRTHMPPSPPLPAPQTHKTTAPVSRGNWSNIDTQVSDWQRTC